MPEIEVTKRTKWECQRCGECCKGIIVSKEKSISVVENGKHVCRLFDGSAKTCRDYENRPFICRIYPFVIGLDNIVEGGTAKPRKAFLLENMKIHSECPGYGKGRRVFANNSLKRKFEKLG